MNLHAMPTTEFSAIKSKQKVDWASGDYAKIGTTLQVVGEELAEAVDLSPATRVLDVAAGNGNATLAFARRWCDVTSTDFVESLLARSEARATAEGLRVKYQVADAEALPFNDEEFDAVVSTFGVMFTPNQPQAAAELIRTCRSGGKIGLSNWTPESFIGALFRTIGTLMAPPPGVQSPSLWGTREWIEETFGAASKSIAFKQKSFVFRYRSPEHFMEVFRAFYGPVHNAFLALDAEQQATLEAVILSLIAERNTATDGSMRLPAEYAEIVMVKA